MTPDRFNHLFHATPANTAFDAWMIKVDAACYKACGVSIHDLSDCCFMDWFEDGVSASSAAKRAIRAENGEDY